MADVHNKKPAARGAGWKWFAIPAAIVLAIGAAVWTLRLPLAKTALSAFLSGRDLPVSAIELTALDLKSATFSKIVLVSDGPADGTLRDVRVTYGLGELITERRVNAVIIERGDLTLRGMTTTGSEAGQMPLNVNGLPIDTIMLGSLNVRVAMPFVDLSATLGGSFLPARGGELKIENVAGTAMAAQTALDITAGKGALAFKGDGSLAGALDLSASGNGAGLVTDDVALNANFTAGDWRSLLQGNADSFTGEGEIRLSAARVLFSQPQPGAEADARASELIRPGAAQISAGLSIRLGADGTEISGIGGQALLNVVTETGGVLELFTPPDRVAYSRSGDGAAMAILARLRDPGQSETVADAQFSSVSDDGRTWQFTADASLDASSIFGLEPDKLSVAINGEAQDGQIDGKINFTGGIAKADFRRLHIENATSTIAAAFRADMKARQIIAHLEECANLPQADFSTPSEGLRLRLSKATLCATAEPVLTADLGEAAHIRLAGRLVAKTGRMDIGATTIDGAPPELDIALDYAPQRHETLFNGTFAGGRVVVNKAISFFDVDGTLRGKLGADGFITDVTVSEVTTAQASKAPIATPMIAKGEGTLRDQIFDFTFSMSTPSGLPLGKGKGRHDVNAVAGTASFATGPLEFTPERLRLSDFSPLFRGVVSDAKGAADGKFKFGWRGTRLTSGAEINLEELSFQGPTLAVSRTSGVSGKIVLTDLLPVKTDGAQNVRVRLIDLDALQLEDGEILLELPGDGTARINRASFPWFGGEIGVFNANTFFETVRSEFQLRASNVNLGAFLDYLNVEGLSGSGLVEGTLPLIIENGRARIENGYMRASSPGTLKYFGQAANASSESNQGAAVAFSILRDLRFDTLEAEIDGPLDGALEIKLRFEGIGDLPVDDPRVKDSVEVPVNYTMSITAPILSLIRQGRAASDFRLRIDDFVRSDQAPEEN